MMSWIIESKDAPVKKQTSSHYDFQPYLKDLTKHEPHFFCFSPNDFHQTYAIRDIAISIHDLDVFARETTSPVKPNSSLRAQKLNQRFNASRRLSSLEFDIWGYLWV